MKLLSKQITFIEVPNEVSITLMIAGCPLKCKWCHSPKKDFKEAEELNAEWFTDIINSYKWFITCVCFLWWEWHKDELITLLDISKQSNLKTCLYTWLTKIDWDIKKRLDYLKTWPWIQSLWWLNSKTTNQKFKNLKTWEDLTYLFQKIEK